MFEFDNPTEKPVIRKTVDDIISQFSTMIAELEQAATHAEEDIDRADKSINLWENEKALAQNELASINSVKEKLQSLRSGAFLFGL